jgi:hypothetical protein
VSDGPLARYDAACRAIAEARSVDEPLAVRSDLAIEAQVSASGATWLDRQLVARSRYRWAAALEPRCCTPWSDAWTI